MLQAPSASPHAGVAGAGGERGRAFTQEAVAAAVQALHHPATPPATRKQADAFLIDFQRSREAWLVAPALCNEDPSADPEAEQRVFFGAMTLYRKIQTAYAELPVDRQTELRDMLVAFIIRLNDAAAARLRSGAKTGGPALIVLRRLALAYAALVIQSEYLTAEAVMGVLVNGAFGAPDGSRTVAMLEILTCLVEELNDRASHATSFRRSDFRRGLGSVAKDVLQALYNVLLPAGRDGNAVVVQSVLTCFAAWVRNVTISAAVVAASPLLPATFDALTANPALFDAATTTVQDIVDTFRDVERDGPVVAILLPRILDLESLLDAALASHDTEASKPLTRIIAAACHDYGPDLIVLPGLVPEAVKSRMLGLMTKITASADEESPNIIYLFWRALSEALGGTGSSRKRVPPKGTPEQRRVLQAQLRQALTHTFTLLISKLELPADFRSLPASAQDHFTVEVRYAIGDALECLASVVGVDEVLGYLSKELETRIATWMAKGNPNLHWGPVEACLYALREVSAPVDRFFRAGEDPATTNELSEQERRLESIITALPQLPRTVPELVASVFRVVTSYGAWVTRRTPRLLPGLFDFAVEAELASSPIPALRSAAQQNACRTISSMLLTEDLTALHYLRDRLTALPRRVNFLALHRHNADELIRHWGIAFLSLPPGKHQEALLGLVGPLLSLIQQFCSDPMAGCRTAAESGLLLAALSTQHASADAGAGRYFVGSADVGAAMVAAGKAAGGVIRLSDFPEVDPSLLSQSLLKHVLERLSACVRVVAPSPRSFVAMAAANGWAHRSLLDDPYVTAHPGLGADPSAAVAAHQAEAQATGLKVVACLESADAALLACLQASFPVLSGVVSKFEASGKGPITDRVNHILADLLEITGPATATAGVLGQVASWAGGLHVANPSGLALRLCTSLLRSFRRTWGAPARPDARQAAAMEAWIAGRWSRASLCRTPGPIPALLDMAAQMLSVTLKSWGAVDASSPAGRAVYVSDLEQLIQAYRLGDAVVLHHTEEVLGGWNGSAVLPPTHAELHNALLMLVAHALPATSAVLTDVAPVSPGEASSALQPLVDMLLGLLEVGQGGPDHHAAPLHGVGPAKHPDSDWVRRLLGEALPAIILLLCQAGVRSALHPDFLYGRDKRDPSCVVNLVYNACKLYGPGPLRGALESILADPAFFVPMPLSPEQVAARMVPPMIPVFPPHVAPSVVSTIFGGIGVSALEDHLRLLFDSMQGDSRSKAALLSPPTRASSTARAATEAGWGGGGGGDDGNWDPYYDDYYDEGEGGEGGGQHGGGGGAFASPGFGAGGFPDDDN